MAFAPSTFKTKLSKAGGGARPSLYKVKINYSVDYIGKRYAFDHNQEY